jgi:formamidopyrimidine-DNA glycosylase
MPELPEVETTIRGLRPLILSSIVKIKIHTPKLRFFIPKSIMSIKKQTNIKDIKRRGKFIILYLSSEYCIVFHLGMSGRLRVFFNSNFIKKKHDHFILSTNKEQFLVFNDPRRFGFVDFGKTKDILNKKYIINLGIDALDKNLTGNYLFDKISKTSVQIKQVLLDQRVLSGIGNIYASEILFNAKISPLREGKNLNNKECNQLVISTKKILKKAIKSGGSTLRDYVSADGTLGNFQKNFKVYNKEGDKIFGHPILKIVQYGRSTYYCPKIQKKV